MPAGAHADKAIERLSPLSNDAQRQPTTPALAAAAVNQSINQSINVTSVAMKFIENSCQPFTKNHLFS
jgi:hypothetical protein